MARTYKDVGWRYRYNDLFGLDERDKPKQRRDCYEFWPQATPSWWTRVVMNRPLRRATHMWEKRVLADIEQADPIPETPKKYYW